MNKKFEKLGFYPADILLPKDQDMRKWAVVACDQFTSEPEYWQAVEQTVGDAPSTLRLILPEANLKAPNVDEYIADINASMDKYLAGGVFQVLPEYRARSSWLSLKLGACSHTVRTILRRPAARVLSFMVRMLSITAS